MSGLSGAEVIIYPDAVGILFLTEGLESIKQKLKVYLFASCKAHDFFALSNMVRSYVLSVI